MPKFYIYWMDLFSILNCIQYSNITLSQVFAWFWSHLWIPPISSPVGLPHWGTRDNFGVLRPIRLSCVPIRIELKFDTRCYKYDREGIMQISEQNVFKNPPLRILCLVFVITLVVSACLKSLKMEENLIWKWKGVPKSEGENNDFGYGMRKRNETRSFRYPLSFSYYIFFHFRLFSQAETTSVTTNTRNKTPGRVILQNLHDAVAERKWWKSTWKTF